MITLRRMVSTVGFVIGLLVLAILVTPPATRRLIASKFAIATGAVGGLTNHWIVPAYLKGCHYTATTTGNVCHTGPTVIGCVIINTAGAASSTITLYDQAGLVVNASYVQDLIDATQVGRQFCYGRLFKGGLVVVHASGGAAADFTVTYQGQ